jgi:hypothetical protein
MKPGIPISHPLSIDDRNNIRGLDGLALLVAQHADAMAGAPSESETTLANT